MYTGKVFENKICRGSEVGQTQTVLRLTGGIFSMDAECRGRSVVERMPEEHGVGCSIHPRGTVFAGIPPKFLDGLSGKIILKGLCFNRGIHVCFEKGSKECPKI